MKNQLFWAGLVAGVDLMPLEESMGAVAHDGDLAPFTEETLDRVLELWETPGVLEATHATPFGSLPGSAVINFAIIDAIAHAWDISASVGRPIEFAAESIPAISAVVEFTCTEHTTSGPDQAPDQAAGGRNGHRTPHGCRRAGHHPITSSVPMKSPSLTDRVTRMIRLAALVTLVGCLIMVPATAARAHGDHDARPLLRQAEAVPIWVLTVSDFGGPDLASTARGAWTALKS